MLASSDAPWDEVDRREIREAIDRAELLLRGLLDPSDEEPPAESDVAAVLAACQTRLTAAAHPCRLHLSVEDAPCWVSSSALDIERAVTNLVVNATAASDAESPITVRLECVEDLVVVEVIDAGRGMPRRELAQARHVGFSTKVDGAGLGLAAVDAIMSRIGGSFALQTVAGSGTTATCRFPRSSGSES